MPTGSEEFLELPVALGFGPATGPTLKTALCHIRTLVGRRINIDTRLSSIPTTWPAHRRQLLTTMDSMFGSLALSLSLSLPPLSLILMYLGYGFVILKKYLPQASLMEAFKSPQLLFIQRPLFTCIQKGRKTHVLLTMFQVRCHAGTEHVFQEPKRIKKLFLIAKRLCCQNYIHQQASSPDI